MAIEVRKTTPGESYIHNHGRVAGGETIAVDSDTAAYLVDSGSYEYAESDAESEPDTDTAADTADTDADVEGDDTGAEDATQADLIEQGICPWCDEYDGESVGRHASAAHTEEWNAYKEAAE